MSNILYIGNSFEQISKVFSKHNVFTLNTSEAPTYDEENIINHIHNLDLNSINLIFCELPSSVLVLSRLIKNGRYGGPIILVPHLNPYPLKNLLSILIFLQNTPGQSIIVCGSHSSAMIYKKLFEINPIVLPTYGIDKNNFNKKGKEESRRILGLGEDSKILLYTGRVAPDKNIGGIFAAYNSLCKDISNLNLVIAYNKIVDTYAQRLVFQWKPDNFILLTLDMDKLQYVYSASDLFVSCSTSYFETFGRSPLEANACGIPSVVPNWIGFNSYSSSRNGSMVNVDFFEEQLYDDKNYSMVNLESFTEACKYYLDNGDFDLGIDGYLAKDEVCNKYMDLIDTVLDQKQSTRAISKHINYSYKLNLNLEGLLDKLRLKGQESIIEAIKTNSKDPMTDIEYRELFYLAFKEAANKQV